MYTALEANLSYIYLSAQGVARMAKATIAEVRCCCAASLAANEPGLQSCRLSLLANIPAASAGETSPFHYVVETDVDPGWEAELDEWYSAEHLPGLAACAGNACTRRLCNLDVSPRYYACYDLASPQVLVSPAWLAVRRTAWSARIRPHFRKTRRTLFCKLLDSG